MKKTSLENIVKVPVVYNLSTNKVYKLFETNDIIVKFLLYYIAELEILKYNLTKARHNNVIIKKKKRLLTPL